MFQLIFSSFCVLNFVFQTMGQSVTVDSNVGTFIGIKSSITIDDTTYNVAKFLGIPYAEPPVGNLRFRVPVPKAPHSGSMIVQQYNQRCLEMFPSTQRPQSEDCLYLNIGVPEVFEFEKLPVMVWFHGGNFIRGSANGFDLDGIVGYGNVIVVSVNYRLNVWGFLSTDDSNSPGNYGLWDQRLAIQWVKDNIEAFEGDTSRITIFGESAGAASVIYQGLYPGNKGLFQRIIAQSGTAAATWSHTVAPKESANALANKVGCYNNDTATMVECLRNTNTSVIQGVVNDVSNILDFSFFPSIDNVFVSCNPDDLLNVDKISPQYVPARETFASFDFLTGINSGEGAMAYNPLYGYLDSETFLPNSSYFRNVLVRNFMYIGFEDRLEATNINTAIDTVYDNYIDDTNVNDSYNIRDRTADIFSDALFLAPLKRTLQMHSQLSSNSTYMYYLSVNPSYHILPTPTWFVGANHADDILYLFPTKVSPYDEQELILAQLMVSSWSNFAKTGNPNSPRDINMEWGEYTEANPRYIDFKRGTTSDDVKEGLFEDRADFWSNEMAAIIGYESEPCEYIGDTSRAQPTGTSSTLILAFFVALYALLFQV